MSNASLERLQRQERLAPSRIIAGAMAAWLFPSFTIGLILFLHGLLIAERPMLEWGVLVTSPLFGLLTGGPTLVIGYLGWRLLHIIGRQGYGAAALLGLGAPLGSIALVAVLQGPQTFLSRSGAAAVTGVILLGVLTGLLVRWIAYPSLADPRQP